MVIANGRRGDAAVDGETGRKRASQSELVSRRAPETATEEEAKVSSGGHGKGIEDEKRRRKRQIEFRAAPFSSNCV